MRVVAYCRYSSNLQREESIMAQLRAIEEFCKKEGYSLVDTYCDEAVSGTTENRPAFQKMLEDCKKSNFDGVIVHKLDRFARNRYDSAIARKRLKDNNKCLISVLERLDGTPESKLMEGLLEGMAEYYSENLAREVKKGLNENALKGLHNGGLAPLGYDVNPDKTYSINEAEASIVREIFDLASAGIGYAHIAYILNEKGYKNKLKREFNKTSIRDTLLNEKYAGVYYYGKKDQKGKLTGKEIRIEGGIPQIIDTDLFEAIQLKMKQRSGFRQRSKSQNDYYLAGFMKCGICGGNYVSGYRSRSRNGSISYGYLCNDRKTKKSKCDCKPLRKELLEDAVFNILRENIFREDVIDKLSNNIFNYLNENSDDTEIKKLELEKDERKVIAKINNLLDLFLDGKLVKEIYEKKNSELEKQLFFIQSEKIAITQSKKFLDLDKIKTYIKKMALNLESRNKALVLTVLNTFVESIIVDNESIKINMSIMDIGNNGGDDGNRTHVRNC